MDIRRAIGLLAAAGLLSLTACASGFGRREAAIAIATSEFQTRFPQEYSIARWDVIAEQEPDAWLVMFAYPIPDDVAKLVREIARSGRLFIISDDASRIVDTLSMQ